MIKPRFKLVFWIVLTIITVSLLKLSASPDSLVSWYIGTTKSELWAISQKLRNYPPMINQPESDRSKSFANHSPQTENIVFHENSMIANAQSIPQELESASQFPLGWYDGISNPNTLDQISQEGMNLVMPYTGDSTTGEIKSYLDRAAAAGMKVLIEIPRLEVRRDHRWLITQYVKELKDHPAVYGWYLFDEPEFYQISPLLLERVYKAIKTEDPQHKIAIAFGKFRYIKKYIKALDTVIYFKYPIMEDSLEFAPLRVPSFSNLLQTVSKTTPKNHDLIFVLQGYGKDKYGRSTKFKRRLPTLAESRYMIYSALLAQADGLLFWAHYRSQQQWIDSVLTPTMEEIKSLLPAIKSKASAHNLRVKNPQVQARIYQNSTTKDLLLVAINHSSRKISTAIAVGDNVTANTAQVLSTKRSVNLTGGMMKDVIEPYGVHIYQLN